MGDRLRRTAAGGPSRCPVRCGRPRQAGDQFGERPPFDGGVSGFTQDVGRNTVERRDETLGVRLLVWLDRPAESALDEVDGRGRVESAERHPGSPPVITERWPATTNVVPRMRASVSARWRSSTSSSITTALTAPSDATSSPLLGRPRGRVR